MALTIGNRYGGYKAVEKLHSDRYAVECVYCKRIYNLKENSAINNVDGCKRCSVSKKSMETLNDLIEKSRSGGTWHWTILEPVKILRSPLGVIKVECQCSCGTRRYVWASTLKKGGSKSCGRGKHDSSIINNCAMLQPVGLPIDGVVECRCQCDRICFRTLSELRRGVRGLCDYCLSDKISNRKTNE